MHMQPVSSNNLLLYNPARHLLHRTRLSVVLFLAAHIPLALLLRQQPLLAALHGAAVLLLGLVYALHGDRLVQVAATGAYITGAEVLWRMAKAPLPWEYGKYAVVAIFSVAMLRKREWHWQPLALIYVLCLLPSAVLTLTSGHSESLRQTLSFNLSGPLSLAISYLFFSQLRITKSELDRLFLALIAPAIAVATVALAGTLSAQALVFTTESNFATSGGFGPNQVSTILGLGSLFAALLAVRASASRPFKLLLWAIAIWLLAQAILTFSRGGVFTAIVAFGLGAVFLLRTRGGRVRLLLIAGLLGLTLAYIVWPQLDAFTGGKLTSRYEEASLTNRDSLIRSSLQLWIDNPVFGVGPGEAKYQRQLDIFSGQKIAEHTEFSRLVGEHGLFGVAALLILMTMGIKQVSGAHTASTRSFVIVLLSWSLLTMLHAAMRLAAPGWIFGLAAAELLSADAEDLTHSSI